MSHWKSTRQHSPSRQTPDRLAALYMQSQSILARQFVGGNNSFSTVLDHSTVPHTWCPTGQPRGHSVHSMSRHLFFSRVSDIAHCSLSTATIGGTPSSTDC